MGHIYAFMTGIRLDGAITDRRRETHGWVDLTLCRTTLWHSRHHVRPLIDWVESDLLSHYENYADMVRDNVLAALCELTGGYVDNDDGTFTGTSVEFAHSPDDHGVYRYEIHFFRRVLGPRVGPRRPGIQAVTAVFVHE